VPFGEYIPFGEMLSTWGVRGLATRDGAGYVAGTGERLLEIPKIGRVIPLICYELIFPRNVRSKNRARLILQITNDAWFGNFSGPFQHLAQAKLRAIEQGLPLIRVANTGISAVLNSRGEVVVKTSLNEATYIDANIPSPRSKTIYAKFADWPMIIFLSFSIFILSFLRKRVY
jgi:apolipoprotein N-acyltransferase